jgi:hypothetical protein
MPEKEILVTPLFRSPDRCAKAPGRCLFCDFARGNALEMHESLRHNIEGRTVDRLPPSLALGVDAQGVVFNLDISSILPPPELSSVAFERRRGLESMGILAAIKCHSVLLVFVRTNIRPSWAAPGDCVVATWHIGLGGVRAMSARVDLSGPNGEARCTPFAHEPSLEHVFPGVTDPECTMPGGDA